MRTIHTLSFVDGQNLPCFIPRSNVTNFIFDKSLFTFEQSGGAEPQPTPCSTVPVFLLTAKFSGGTLKFPKTGRIS